jgi:hypothetical protein
MCSFVTWPMILEQAEINGFGPLSRDVCSEYLKPEFCLLRRSPYQKTPKEWYLTCMDKDGEIQNYRISLLQGRDSRAFYI